MIESITIKNITSYDGVTGATIEGLKKVNFFFGNNGSGKSTIAKYLYNLSLDEPSEISFSHCVQSGYDSESNQILVFNEDFIERNFISRDTQVGIFSLNQENEEIDRQITEKQSLLEILKNKIDRNTTRLSSIKKKKEEKFEKLKKECFELRKSTLKAFPKIKDSFPNKVTKNNFDAILSTLKMQPLQDITFDMLLADYKKYFDSELTKIETVISMEPYQEIIDIEVGLNTILQKVIIGNADVDIAGMIESLQNKKWVEDGMGFLAMDKDLQTCPFCQKETVDQELIEKFKQYFDESYKKDIQSIVEFQTQYEEAYHAFKSNLDQVVGAYNTDNKVSNLIESIKEVFDKNIKAIEEKLANSNEKEGVESIINHQATIEEINGLIEANNQDFDNLDMYKKVFFSHIWVYLSKESKNNIEGLFSKEDKYNRLFELFEEKILTLNTQKNSLKLAIEALRDQTVSTKEAVDNINVILKNSGFYGFEIEEKEQNANNISEYYLKRDNGQDDNIFKSLSEGEKNFIAFLYFYQLCLGADSPEEPERKKIIVIDDPVSSLDSQVLFIVNSLIQYLIARKGKSKPDKKEFISTALEQIFILTHNIYFHKEVSLDNKRTCMDRNFYTIQKINGISSIAINENPIVNDYFLLWSALINIKEDIVDDATNTVHNISITNLMRRILESYVNFTGLGNSVWDAIKDINPEDPVMIICSSLISELQDGSHKVSPLDEIYFTRIINEEPQKLFDAFELVFKGIGRNHYLIMMGIDES